MITLGSIGVALAPVLAAPAGAAVTPRAAIVHYRNCTAVHLHYRGGIARVGAKDHRTGGGHARYAPYVSTALYTANRRLDRDHDGIACEQ